MESANLHPHNNNVQEQYVKYSSDMFSQTGHQVSTTDEWNLSPNSGTNYLTETIPTKSRDLLWPPVPPLISSFNQQSGAGANEISSDYSFPKRYCDHHQYYLGGNLWHTNINANNDNNIMTQLQLSSSGDLYTNNNIADHDFGISSSAAAATTSSRSSYDHHFNHHHTFPMSTNISTSDLCSTLFSSSFDLNLKSLDLLTSTYDDDGGFNCNNQSLIDSTGKLSRSLMSHDRRREQRSDDSPFTTSKVSAFVSGPITSTKRPSSSFSETKESHNTTDAKKHRSSQSPCPTLKVRKEKLGDRVAALQKLVAPFGKTDTASVLTEAIGYIQFLHNQVQTLSVPFTKSSQNKFHRIEKVGSRDQEQEQKCDLRSRGLCLVPQSCASYFISSCTNEI